VSCCAKLKPAKHWRLKIVPRILLLVSAFLLAAALPVTAIGQPLITRQYTGKPATDIKVGIFSSIRGNCTAGPLPAVRLVSPPTHGKVTVTQGKITARNIRDCLATTELPALVAIYRSNANFSGEDVFTIELIDAKGKSQVQRITVNIVKAPNQKDI
jgi:hypothetical protein